MTHSLSLYIITFLSLSLSLCLFGCRENCWEIHTSAEISLPNGHGLGLYFFWSLSRFISVSQDYEPSHLLVPPFWARILGTLWIVFFKGLILTAYIAWHSESSATFLTSEFSLLPSRLIIIIIIIQSYFK